MNKKTYIQPETKSVYTAQTILQATSLHIDNSSANILDDSNDILVKEDRGGVWDDEW